MLFGKSPSGLDFFFILPILPLLRSKASAFHVAAQITREQDSYLHASCDQFTDYFILFLSHKIYKSPSATAKGPFLGPLPIAVPP